MTKEAVDLLSRVQVRVRSDFFGGYGGRWGPIPILGRDMQELQLKRMRVADDARRLGLRHALIRSLRYE